MGQTRIDAGKNVRPLQLEAELHQRTKAPLAVYQDDAGNYFVIVAASIPPALVAAMQQTIAAHVPAVTQVLTDAERAAAVEIATIPDLDLQKLTSAGRLLANVISRVAKQGGG